MTPRLALGLAVAAMLLAPIPVRAADTDKTSCLHSYEAAQRLRLAKKLVASREQLRICSHASCPSVLADDCGRWLAEVERAIPSLRISARADGTEVGEVEVRVDDMLVAESLDQPIILDPGPHELRFDYAGRPAVVRKLRVNEGEQERRLEIDFGAEAAPGSGVKRNVVPLYGLGALGALGIGSFVFFGLRSHAAKQDLEDCKGHCPEDDVDAVRTDQIVADVSLGVGLVALGALGYLYFAADSPKESGRPRWHVGVAPAPSGAAATVRAAF